MPGLCCSNGCLSGLHYVVLLWFALCDCLCMHAFMIHLWSLLCYIYRPLTTHGLSYLCHVTLCSSPPLSTAFPLLCLAGVFPHMFESYLVSLCLGSICFVLCPTLLVSYTWRVGGVAILPSMSHLASGVISSSLSTPGVVGGVVILPQLAMMMILHQVRHGKQDNHATNHVRCAETSRAKQSRRHIEAKHSETIDLSIMCQWSTTPAKQSTEKAPRQCLLGKHNQSCTIANPVPSP
jgi:hypothetical protein